MTVVIGEFEVVPPPGESGATPAKEPEAADDAPPPLPAPRDVERALAHALARLARVRAD